MNAFKKTAQYKEGPADRRADTGPALLPRLRSGLDAPAAGGPLRRGLLSDVHAPAKWRVLGPLANIPEFYAAFGVQHGQPMWRAPEAQVHIW